MKVTRSQSFSDFAGMTPDPCDFCSEPLPNGQQLWKIDDDDSNGFYCSKSCAQQAIERFESEEE